METDFVTLKWWTKMTSTYKIGFPFPCILDSRPHGRLERKRNKIFTRPPPGEEHFTIIWAKKREKR